MKVKYFVRGLGIGILITALILGISYKSKNSDEDIILRAKKLGMVFSEDASGSALELDDRKTPEPAAEEETSAIPEMTELPSLKSTEDPSPDSTEHPTKEPSPKPTESQAPEPFPDSTAEPLSEPTGVPVTDEAEKVSFLIERGDWSRIVSEKLENLGIIDNAKKFDKYLVDNGYAVRIKVGEFSAKKGASYEEIAKMITD